MHSCALISCCAHCAHCAHSPSILEQLLPPTFLLSPSFLIDRTSFDYLLFAVQLSGTCIVNMPIPVSGTHGPIPCDKIPFALPSNLHQMAVTVTRCIRVSTCSITTTLRNTSTLPPHNGIFRCIRSRDGSGSQKGVLRRVSETRVPSLPHLSGGCHFAGHSSARMQTLPSFTSHSSQ